MASTINWAFNLETIQTQAQLSMRRAERSPTECGVIAYPVKGGHDPEPSRGATGEKIHKQ
jgi:hypothetical protein